MPVSDYKELRVYQKAFEAAMHIFELTKSWPKHERYSMTDQVRRSSRSVCANICEAWFRRKYPKYFVSKLSDASTEAGETITWLDFAQECEYLTEEQVQHLKQSYRHVIGGLVKMMDRPDQWCIGSNVSEPSIPYDTESVDPDLLNSLEP